MGNLSGKGYANRGTAYEFKLPNGKKVIYTSNACRYKDALAKAQLPDGTTLVNSTTYYLSNGKNKNAYTDVIWAIEGATPSGKLSVEYLVELGAITQAQAETIRNAKEVRL